MLGNFLSLYPEMNINNLYYQQQLQQEAIMNGRNSNNKYIYYPYYQQVYNNNDLLPPGIMSQQEEHWKTASFHTNNSTFCNLDNNIQERRIYDNSKSCSNSCNNSCSNSSNSSSSTSLNNLLINNEILRDHITTLSPIIPSSTTTTTNYYYPVTTANTNNVVSTTTGLYYPINNNQSCHLRRSSVNTSRSSSPSNLLDVKIMTRRSSTISSNNPVNKKYSCGICTKRFTRPSSLTTHIYSHTGEKPFKCSVEGCGRNFSVVSNLRRHAKIHGNHQQQPTSSFTTRSSP